MRLLCPHCGKAYIVRDDVLGAGGRSVRCSSCKSTWFANASGEAQTPALAYDGANPHALIEQVRRATAEKPSKLKKNSTSGKPRPNVDPGMAILCALVVCLVCGLFFREGVVKTMPSFARLYNGIGLSVNVRGLEFADIKSSRELQNGEPVLIVEGKIMNIKHGDVDVPAVRVALRSPTGAEIDAAIVRPDSIKLELAGETTFRTMLVNPPADAKDVLVHFSDLQNLGS